MLSSDRKLAGDHVRWYMSILREQMESWLTMTEKLMLENFIHGIKHGRELEIKERGLEAGPNGAGVDSKAGAE